MRGLIVTGKNGGRPALLLFYERAYYGVLGSIGLVPLA